MGALSERRIGLVGLGLMVKPIARNLHRAGAQLTVWNRSPGPMAELAADGIATAASPKAVARASDAVVIMVADTPAVDLVLHGDDGVIAGVRAGQLVIDMGTTRVPDTRKWAAEVSSKGADYIDAPVSGGQVAATDGTLIIMAGGAADAFDRARPIFETLRARITHVGDVGAGQVAKAANQIIVAMTLDAVAEALTLAARAGVDPAKVRAAMRGGFADARILELHGQRTIERTFAPGGRVTVQHKDVVQALDLAASLGLAMPGLQRNKELWHRMIAEGWGDLDHSAIIKAIETG